MEDNSSHYYSNQEVSISPPSPPRPLVMERIGDPYSTTVPPTEDDGNTSRRNTTIDALPEDLLSEILVRNSDEDIGRLVLVCKRWCRTIHGRAFVAAHLHRSGYGLLLSRGFGCKPNFVAAATQGGGGGGGGGGGIEVSKLNCKLESLIISSCNGLILGIHNTDTAKPNFYIANPLTKACFDLPQIPEISKLRVNSFGIAYAPASMEYKVVVTYCPDYSINPMLARCVILTVGVDNTWRRVATEQLPPVAKEILCRDPLITEGFMHWAYWWLGNSSLTMNMETEVLAETPAPPAPPPRSKHWYVSLETSQGRRFEHWYLSTGRNLSVLFCCGDLLWEVWEMKGETGEWRKVIMPNIDLNACKNKHALVGDFFKPIGWVKYPKVLLISHGYTNCSCFVYNLDNNESVPVKVPLNALTKCIVPVVHKKSLVRLN